MGDFPVSDFISVGFLSSPAQKFNITVNCDTTVQPELKITSANGYDTAFEGVIKLTQQTGMATGVGVRMLFDDHLATFGTYVSTQNQAVANETLVIPFEVRYPGQPILWQPSPSLISERHEKNRIDSRAGADRPGPRR